jgi:hypothetical protein
MAATKPEHFLFRKYSKAVKEWLQNTVYLSNYSKENNVSVHYMTPDRAWAEFVHPVINGGTLSPNINFYLESMEYKEGENLLGFVKEHRTIDGENRALNAPLIYRLTYSCTIFTRSQAEQDIIFYQLVSNAHQNKKAAVIVDGQWAEIEAREPSNETNLEPGETQEIVRRGGISLIIDRAYLPLEYDSFTKVEDYDFDFEVDSYINGE